MEGLEHLLVALTYLSLHPLGMGNQLFMLCCEALPVFDSTTVD